MTGEGQEYRVTVSYAGGWEARSVQRTLTIATADPKQPEIRIPIQALLKAAPAGHAHR